VLILIAKRALLLLAELVTEAFLLGALLGAWAWRITTGLSWPANKSIGFVFIVVPAVYGWAVAVVLFLHGYYLTRGILGLVWRNTTGWLYPVIAAILFFVHLQIGFARVKEDLTPEATAFALPFEVVGAGIVLVCAFAGNRVLRKWLHGAQLQSRTIQPKTS
jgi:hypothetical protein